MTSESVEERAVDRPEQMKDGAPPSKATVEPMPDDGKPTDDPRLKSARKEAAERRIALREMRNQMVELQNQLATLSQSLENERKERERAVKEAREAAKRAERESAVAELAVKYSLPPNVARRLQGESREELEADAKSIAEEIRSVSGWPPKARPNAAATGMVGNVSESTKSEAELQAEQIIEMLKRGRSDNTSFVEINE